MTPLARAIRAFRANSRAPASRFQARLTSQPSAYPILQFRKYSGPAALSRSTVEERVLGVLRAFDRVNQEKVSLDAKFTSDLGLDSLDVVEVMIAVEEEFHLEIPDEVADKVSTPKEAVDYILQAQAH